MQSYSVLQDALETFWQHWHKDYLQNLAERNQKRLPQKQGSKSSPRVGDVVLIKQENISRSSWPLGLIVQINESVDGFTRSVKVKTNDRSINQLIPLEVSTEDKAITTKQKRVEQPTRIQPDRRVKRRTPSTADLWPRAYLLVLPEAGPRSTFTIVQFVDSFSVHR
ncbi:hypothetical protein OSTOST_13284 [Ostertagia ostertagi]